MYVSYSKIVNGHSGAEKSDQVDEIYYNGIDTMVKKVQLAKDSETGGIMIWEITQDVDSNDDRSLLKAIYDEALSSASAAR
jgi:GH18 family chitinase